MTASVRAAAAALTRRLARPQVAGRVQGMTGLVISASTPGARIGDVVVVAGGDGPIRCEVVGFRDDDVLLVPLGASRAIGPGASALRQPAIGQLAVGDELLGRLVDPFGAPLDGLPPPRCRDRVELDQPALPVHLRAEVTQRFDTGIRVIDGLLTCGRGQRIGVFAGAGCGKSVLVEQIASHSAADVVVIGLIGERGREVRDLLARTHGARLVAVAATADRSPLERVRGALAATAIAEYFRDRGGHVLLVLDSLTRYAMALREVGLSLGEPPATKGYPPSVFATLPRLLERVAPRAGGGSITGFYTVLVEGDDLADPIADSARSLLDAHVVLSRDLAGRGHFPAVDVLASASRVAGKVTAVGAHRLAQGAREQLARRRQALELQSLGAYHPGANPTLDQALAVGEKLDAWARQPPTAITTYPETLAGLGAALGEEASS